MSLAARDTAAGVALKRVAIVVAELAGVVLVGAACTWIVAVDAMYAIGATALVYYPVASLCLDRRLGIRSLRAVVKSPLPLADQDVRAYEDIKDKELQVSF
jgi:hypothetical protein